MGAQPLAGLRIVNTRAARQAPSLTRLLEAEGAQVLHYPTVEIVPCADSGKLDGAIRALAAGRFDWLVITSANTVYVLADRMRDLGILQKDGTRSKTSVAAVGSATAAAIREELDLAADLVPEEYVADSLADGLHAGRGSRVLLPQSAIARPALAQALRAAGAEVTQVAAYRTAAGRGGDDLPAQLRRGNVDAVLFTSASTVDNFVARVDAEGGDTRTLRGAAVACIGPLTAEAARRRGFHVQVVARNRTVKGLVNGLKIYFSARTGKMRRVCAPA